MNVCQDARRKKIFNRSILQYVRIEDVCSNAAGG